MQYIVNASSWHIHYIVVYKNCYWVLHAFLLGGIGRPAYVRSDPPVHVVRFVRYVITMVRDYYTLLRSRSALCLYGFCRMAFQLFGILERDERAFYASSSLFVSTDYGKTPTIHPCASLIHWYRIQGRSKWGRSKLGRNGENIGCSAPYRSEKNVEYLEEHSN